jgi:hypothetical protein
LASPRYPSVSSNERTQDYHHSSARVRAEPVSLAICGRWLGEQECCNQCSKSQGAIVACAQSRINMLCALSAAMSYCVEEKTDVELRACARPEMARCAGRVSLRAVLTLRLDLKRPRRGRSFCRQQLARQTKPCTPGRPRRQLCGLCSAMAHLFFLLLRWHLNALG